MAANTDLLFVYGTLLIADNHFARYMNKHAVFHSTGKFKGKLYDIGNYPGAVSHHADDYYVQGSIYHIQNPDAWVVLDEYEGITPTEPHPQQYVREQVDIVTDSGVVKSWIYLFNWPLDEKTLIAAGNYLKYIAAKND